MRLIGGYAMDKFEVLKNYKDLLDQGIITQEEFETKKKEILDAPESSSALDSLMKGAKEKTSAFKEKTEKKIEEVTKKQEEQAAINRRKAEENKVIQEAERERREAEKQKKKEEFDKKRKELLAKKSTKVLIALACAVVLLIIAFCSYIYPQVVKPMQKYNTAVRLLESGKIDEAENMFKELGDYKDSVQQIENCDIARADEFVSKGYYEGALAKYLKYKNNPKVTEEKINQCKEGIYQEAVKLLKKGNYEDAREKFELISDYSDTKEQLAKCDKAKEDAEKAAQDAAEKKAAEENEKRENSGLIGTWYAKTIVNYLGNDMTDQMGDLSYYYITFNVDGTGVFSAGEDKGKPAWGGEHDFTWKIEDTGAGNGSVGTWTMNGDTDDIFYYDDHIVISTEKMDSIFYDMNFFCFR